VNIGGTLHGSKNSTSFAQASPGNIAIAVNGSMALERVGPKTRHSP
jgi:hypothetical protein